MSNQALEARVVSDFNRHLELIKIRFREMQEADSGLTSSERAVVNYIMELDSVDNIEQVEIIHYGRNFIREEVSPDLNNPEATGHRIYDKADLHQDADGLNEKLVSADGVHEYIRKPVGTDSDGQTIYELVTTPELQGSVNFSPNSDSLLCGLSEATDLHLLLDVNPWVLFGNTGQDNDGDPKSGCPQRATGLLDDYSTLLSQVRAFQDDIPPALKYGIFGPTPVGALVDAFVPALSEQLDGSRFRREPDLWPGPVPSNISTHRPRSSASP